MMNKITNPTITQIKKQYKNSALPAHWWQSWLLFVLDKPSSFLITDGVYVLSDDEHQAFLVGIERMMAGEPLAYLLGYQAFWGRDFLLNAHTLIPRADTELLVATALSHLQSRQITAPSVLDLGTGSGCIAITLAKELPNATVLAVDCAASALGVARTNAQRLQAHNCQFLHSDWFDKVVGRFEMIVANPPYIAKDDVHLSALHAEPIGALVADKQGLADIERIVGCAKDHLSAGGMLAIEHGYNQAKQVRQLFAQAGFCQVRTIKDYGGNDRVTTGICDG